MRSLLRYAECSLWTAGALATGYCAGGYLESHFFQARESKLLEDQLHAAHPPIVPSRHTPREAGSLVGRLEIPRLEFKVMVLEGSDTDTLRVGVGRVPESSTPGERGNMVLGGHRDTFFRPLKGIREGDTIDLVTPSGKYSYNVEWTEVVDPTDTEVLQPTREPSLTLITCYPFYYIGPAPKRFVVRARQVVSENEPATAGNSRPGVKTAKRRRAARRESSRSAQVASYRRMSDPQPSGR